MTHSITTGSLSALEPCIQRGSADLRQRCYVSFRKTGGDALTGELPEFDGRFLDVFGVLSPVRGVLSDPLTEFCGIHGRSVNHLTSGGKGRKVLYMETTPNLNFTALAGEVIESITIAVTRITADEITGVRQPAWKFGATPRTWMRSEIEAA